MQDVLKILCIGAHPDDCDLKVGGLAIKYARLGHKVRFVSLCNGNAGHHEMGGGPLARRRHAETQRSAAIASAGASGSVEYVVLDIPDCQLMPTLENRWIIINMIREFQADLVITNRPNDYMADHRYASQLVQDAAYIVTVPNVVALTPHLSYNPVFAFWSDDFQRPYPFTPDVAIAIDDVIETKLDMLMCHESQMFEWLPYNMNILDQVPHGQAEQRSFLARLWLPDMEREAERYRSLLQQLYGQERGRTVRYAECLEFCEYGSRVTDETLPRLFPFFE
ncbi:MAG: PIG-L deacetylase family protein [Anaerolineae bacterium]